MKPGILIVTENAARTIEASSAEIDFTVEGTRFFVGNAALQRCDEINKIVTGLKRRGVAESALKIKSVKAEHSKGVFGSSSSATYKLQLYIDDLGQMSDVMGEIVTGDHVKLERIGWRYANEQGVRKELSAEAARYAMEKGTAIAQAAGQRVVGLRYAADREEIKPAAEPELPDLSDDQELSSFGGYAKRKRASSAPSLNLGTSYSSTREVKCVVSLELLVVSADGQTAPDPAAGPAESDA